MSVCPHCQHNNLTGALVCEQCNSTLWQDEEHSTRILEDTVSTGIKSGWGTSTLSGMADIVLHIGDEKILFTTHPGDQIYMGRLDSASDSFPELDLTSYGAADKGVSRRHAVLHREEKLLLIMDLESANGTCVNGRRLEAESSQILHDGDEIRLGSLIIYLYFK